MNIIVTESYLDSCKLVANEIVKLVQSNPTAKLGLATGGTAEKVYPHIIAAYQAGEVDFSNVSTVNLDEYIGMPAENPVSYRSCMDNWFFKHVNIDPAHTYVPNGMNDPKEELKSFGHALYGDKLLDFQLLGVGVSGHIGFNEPGATLTAGPHTQKLDASTIQANSIYFDSPDLVPTESITMGVGDILKANKIVLIVTGQHKAPTMRRLLQDDTISTDLPVSLLKLHKDATIVMDRALAEQCGYSDAT